MNTLRLLILGANGFLGSNIIKNANIFELFDLLGISRSILHQANHVSLDVRDREGLEKTLKEFDPDVIIWALMNQEDEMKLIENGMRNLIPLLKKETKLIYISTDAFFDGSVGQYNESFAIEMEDVLNSSSVSNYAKAKLKGEIIVKENHPNHIIVRTGPLYGEGAKNKIENRTERIIRLIENNETDINISNNLLKTFVHVEDLSKAILELCTNHYEGIIHLGPRTKESYYTFFKKRLKQLGYSSDIIYPKNDGSPRDTSLDTRYASMVLETKFRGM